MDWLWNLMDQLRLDILLSYLMRLHAFDWCVLFAVLWGMSYGSRKGCSDMFGRIVGILLISCSVLAFYGSLSAYLSDHLFSIPLAVTDPISFILLTVFFWIFITWLINVAGKIFHIEITGILRPLGGILLGLVYTLVLASLVVNFLMFFPGFSLKAQIDSGKTYTGSSIAQILPQIHTVVSSPFQRSKPKEPAVSL